MQYKIIGPKRWFQGSEESPKLVKFYLLISPDCSSQFYLWSTLSGSTISFKGFTKPISAPHQPREVWEVQGQLDIDSGLGVVNAVDKVNWVQDKVPVG